ncbi:hypothetical protein MPTK1_5g12490 [Marchantia polymorpha subsp. ruderalis]|uniref:Uncharacterized protein n=2 Tax=Marchantia polymorpha TaxID=3197 RepID=A0AAF6BHM0_MARPO|nr:hypothetical protein MARPO_0092s0057 [Marchantia polymorpha]BBN11504.1 hypothetical protein Mp_5g12490 [Marchantia polymorpha subsp. ruderalis]|eukprot:PTQ33096.1 hypothetical protein MARPO_0092s0057 [Marchantia polymorpha]
MWLRTCCPDGAAKDQTIITDISRFLYEVKPPILLRTSWPYPLRHFLASRLNKSKSASQSASLKLVHIPLSKCSISVPRISQRYLRFPSIAGKVRQTFAWKVLPSSSWSLSWTEFKGCTSDGEKSRG